MREKEKREDNRIVLTCPFPTADQREFIQISKAVGVGFLVMGAIGYLIKLSMASFPLLVHQVHYYDDKGKELFTNTMRSPVHIPVNNILVGAA